MPFALSSLLRIRPYLYHLTDASNLPSIARSLELHCAALLFQRAGLAHAAATRRREHLRVASGLDTVLVRDQAPLMEGAIAFEEGWNLARFVTYVNAHVFFWPGTESGPIAHGLNHFERYKTENPAILRLPTESVFSAAEIRFSRHNSGAPRCSGGKYSPRGQSTYLPASEFAGTASDVIEVVAVSACALPSNVDVSSAPTGPWRSLLSDA